MCAEVAPTALNRASVPRRTIIAALAALALLLAACGGGGDQPSATAEATSTPTEEPTSSSTPTTSEFARSDDPISLAPLAQDVPPTTAAPGLALVDIVNSGVITLTAPPSAPLPIDFRAGGLLTRNGDEYPLLDIDQGEVARARAYGPQVYTSPFAPGVSLEDFDIGSTLEYFVSRRFSDDGLSYDLILVRVEDDQRAVVLEGQTPCDCGALPRGRWSASGRFFFEVGADRMTVVDAIDAGVLDLPAERAFAGVGGATAAWSPVADELLVVGPAGLSILDATSGEVTLVTTSATRFMFTPDGANIVVTDAETNPTTRIFRRDTLEEARSHAGALEDAVAVNNRVPVALSDAPGCDGIWVTDDAFRIVCFESARDVALASNAQVALLYARQTNVGGRILIEWIVETFEAASQLRATVLVWPVDATDPTSDDGIFMVWRDDGQVLALYWPAGRAE